MGVVHDYVGIEQVLVMYHWDFSCECWYITLSLSCAVVCVVVAVLFLCTILGVIPYISSYKTLLYLCAVSVSLCCCFCVLYPHSTTTTTTTTITTITTT